MDVFTRIRRVDLHTHVHTHHTRAASWEKRWKKSSWKEADGTAGEFEWTAGPFYGNEEEDKGIQTSTDARFYTLYSEFSKVFNNKGKDLVLQVFVWWCVVVVIIIITWSSSSQCLFIMWSFPHSFK